MVEILLSTYNGDRYLRQQFDSIRSQDCCEWKILAVDDCSDDKTVEIIEESGRILRDKLFFAGTRAGNSGASQVFSMLLTISTADYRMFCDQDDVWHPDKVRKTLAAMRKAEREYGAETPLLVHTDLGIVDHALRSIAPSFWRYQHIRPSLGENLNRLLTQNVVTGCTVMINRPLARLAAPIPMEAIMHDWWLALVATLFGRVVYLDEPTISYRQHDDNVIGARSWGAKRVWGQARHPQEIRMSMLRSMRQAKALLDRYQDRMTTEHRGMVAAYAKLPRNSRLERIRAAMKYRFLKQGLIRNVGFMANLPLIDRVER
jgi:glycosyltransferase involved in cell wall biosynthesis